MAIVLLCSANTQAAVPRIITSFTADTNSTVFGKQITPLGDQNDDGFADILISDIRWTLSLFYGGPTPDSLPALEIESVNPASNIGDINGDGYDDFVANGRAASEWRLNLYYGGPSIDTVRDG